jgi:hypothetical protein
MDDYVHFSITITSGENGTTDMNISFDNGTHSDELHYRYIVNSFEFVHSYFVSEAFRAYDPEYTQSYNESQDEGDNYNYACERFFVPDHSIMRACSPTIGTCASEWTDSEVEGLCSAYTDVYCDAWDLYRNPHCAVCNNVNLTQTYSCYKLMVLTGKASFADLVNWVSIKVKLPGLDNDTRADVDGGKATIIFWDVTACGSF